MQAAKALAVGRQKAAASEASASVATHVRGRGEVAPRNPVWERLSWCPGARIQPKLKVGRADDPLEREADRVADQVMPMLAPAPVQRLAGSRGGQPLPTPLRAMMEARFGHEFSSVRVHEGPLAAEASRSIGAVAYTLGRDIVFAPGEFQPDTAPGLHLLAHELSHVVQQDRASHTASHGSRSLAPSLIVGPSDSPEERAAELAADAVLRGQPVSPQRFGTPLAQLQVQRAVSKVCNPPSMWFSLGGPLNIPAAAAFGAIAEKFISADILLKNRVGWGNSYLDNPLAGPIDPLYVDFIITKNSGLTALQKTVLAATSVARPDVLMHQAALTEFEEVKPNSVAGRAKGRAKVRAIQAFFTRLATPYRSGTTYTPMKPFVVFRAAIGGVPITITFEVYRDRSGLIVYDICVETDWLIVSQLAIALVIIVLLVLVTEGAILPAVRIVPGLLPRLPALLPAGLPALAQAGAELETPGGPPLRPAEGDVD